MIRYSVIGLLVMVAIILVTPALSAALGFESIGEKFRPANIFQTMKCISDRLFGNTDQSCFEVASGNTGIFSSNSTTGRDSIPTFGTSRTTTGNSPNGAGNWSQDF